MIHSMTGFGRGQHSAKGMTAAAEVKSVNSRYLNISFYIPKEIQDEELALKKQIQERIDRGKINVNIEIDKTGAARPEVDINPGLAKSYKDLLDKLRQTANLEEPITLQDLTQFEEIFVSREQDEETTQTIRKICEEALAQALEQLVETRTEEGSQLQNDLRERADFIENVVHKVQHLSEGRAEQARDELLERIGKLVDDQTLDEERLEMEVAVLVDKMDITEELVRTEAHLKFFKEALEKDEPIGRRLKFLAQEMNREINTIGSKANSSNISQHVVQAKEALEQIREQIANVE